MPAYPKKKRVSVKRGSVAWKRLVKSVFERDGYRCKDCKRVFKFEYLAPCHIKSVGAGGDDTVDNIKTKCLECHGKEHMGLRPTKAEENRLYDYHIAKYFS